MTSLPLGRLLGFGLVGLSFVAYGAVLLVPFTSLPTEAKFAAGGVLVLVGEVSFWAGAALLGRELLRRYHFFALIERYLDPRRWLKR